MLFGLYILPCIVYLGLLLVCTQDKTSVQPTAEPSELSAKLEKVEELERLIEDQKFKISQLREEKVYDA